MFIKVIRRNVIILGFVSLLTDLSGQLVFPLLPLYLTGVLGASAAAVGVVEGSAEAAASLLKVFSGYWSDKFRKRKPFIFAGYGLSAAMKPVLALAKTWPFVLVVRILDRVGKGLRDAPRDAIIADSTTEGDRGRNFGFQRSMDGIGSVGGAVLAFLLLPLLGYTKLFIYAIIPGILSVAVIFFVKEKKERDPEKSISGRTGLSLKVGYAKLTKELKLFILIASLFTLGNYSYAFLMLRAKDLGFNDVGTIKLYALFYFVYSVFSVFSGFFSDKWGRKPILQAGYSLFAATSLGLLLFPQKEFLFVFFVLFGMFFAMVDGTQRALVADISPEHLKGTALGTFHAMTGLAALPAGYIAGTLWDNIGPQGTFLYGFVLSLAAIIIFSFSIKYRREPKLIV